jgi:hypothetical protein
MHDKINDLVIKKKTLNILVIIILEHKSKTKTYICYLFVISVISFSLLFLFNYTFFSYFFSGRLVTLIRLIYNGKQIVFGVFVLDLCSNIMITRIFNVFFFMTRSFILSCMIIIVYIKICLIVVEQQHLTFTYVIELELDL